MIYLVHFAMLIKSSVDLFYCFCFPVLVLVLPMNAQFVSSYYFIVIYVVLIEFGVRSPSHGSNNCMFSDHKRIEDDSSSPVV